MNSLIIILQVKENKNAKYSAYFDNVNLKNQVLSVSVLFVLNYIWLIIVLLIFVVVVCT